MSVSIPKRPKLSETRVIVYVPQHERDALFEAAARTSTTVSAMARQLIARGVRRELAALEAQ